MDQNVILVETVPLEFDLESLGCRLRIRPGQTKFMDRLSRLAEEAARVARPKAVARLCGLTILDEEKVQVRSDFFQPAAAPEDGWAGAGLSLFGE